MKTKTLLTSAQKAAVIKTVTARWPASKDWDFNDLLDVVNATCAAVADAQKLDKTPARALVAKA